jgi:hypothetical protein
MKKITSIVLLIITFTLCIQNLNAGVNTLLKRAISIIEKEKNLTKNETNPCEIIKRHSFSRQGKMDIFKLIFNCENLEDSISFQIIGFSGDLIYEKRFLGISFYDYSRPWYEYITDPVRGKSFDPDKLSRQISDSLHKADLQYIKLRIENFFNEDNFVDNPMMKLSKDKFYKTNYKEISGDPSIIGFKYKLFEGGGFEMIGFSKKTNKTLLIAASD